jgi:hypothetical protein
MSRPEQVADRASSNTHVTSELHEHRDMHPGARRLLQYLNGTRRKTDLSLEDDVLPALVATGGAIALRYHHDDKTEFVYATDATPAAVASCYHDDADALVNNIGFPVDELEAHRGIPDPDDFVHVGYQVPHERPPKAHPRGGDD